MHRFALLLSGPIAPVPALASALAGRRIIAVDGGLQHAATLGLRPEAIIGDFDSAPPHLLAQFADVERHELPRDKGETDGAAGLDLALRLGARDLLIAGALGGARTDHVFTNVALAVSRAGDFARLELFDGRERAFPLLAGVTLRVPARAGTQFSVCRFSDVTGLSIRGAKWPLDLVSVAFGSALTQSNEAIGPVEIEIASGVAFAIFSEIAEDDGTGETK